MATYILNELLTSQNPQVRKVAESHDWYVFPVINPDGFDYTHKTVSRKMLIIQKTLTKTLKSRTALGGKPENHTMVPNVLALIQIAIGIIILMMGGHRRILALKCMEDRMLFLRQQ